jgi:hypothetical protein
VNIWPPMRSKKDTPTIHVFHRFTSFFEPVIIVFRVSLLPLFVNTPSQNFPSQYSIPVESFLREMEESSPENRDSGEIDAQKVVLVRTSGLPGRRAVWTRKCVLIWMKISRVRRRMFKSGESVVLQRIFELERTQHTG